MPYTIVDRNLLIPEIVIKQEFFEGLEELYKKTYSRTKDYNKNIYMIKYSGVRFDGIIKSDGEKIYEVDSDDRMIRNIDIDYSYLYTKTLGINISQQMNTEIKKEKTENNFENKSDNKSNENLVVKINSVPEDDKKSNTSSTIKNVKIESENLDDMDINIKSNKKSNTSSTIKNVKIESENLDDMDINIKSNKKSNIVIDDSDKILLKNDVDEKKLKEKEDKKNELLKMCEQVMDMYNLELNKIKKTELNLLSIDNKIKKLINKKREKIFENITRTKDEYETWKKIKYNIPKENQSMVNLPESELELRENPVIPILFAAKYNYIEKILVNEQVKEIFTVLNNINLADLYVKDEIVLDPKIIKFVEKYTEISKKDLHYKFDHDWDYLDNEFDQVEKNSFTSKKIIDA